MRIHIVPGGPMLVDGIGVAALHRDGDTVSLAPLDAPTPCAICRCGLSGSMPWCDRSDADTCFAEAPSTGPEPAPFTWDVPAPDGPPAVAIKPNGPIRVAGSAPITHGEQVLPARDRTSICRCGASRCQPLCDGSHKAIGFRG
jgi:CDGSH-type Zn-finger protein